MKKSSTLFKSILGISTSAILFFSGTPAFAAPISSNATIGYDSVNSELDFGLSVSGLVQVSSDQGIVSGKFYIDFARVYGWSTPQAASSTNSEPTGHGGNEAVSSVGSGLVNFPLSEDISNFAPITDPYISVCFKILGDGYLAQNYASTYACSESIANPNASGSPASPSNNNETAAPAPSYTGPEISSFNLGSVAPGGSLIATGKKLDQIQSASIGGKAAAIAFSDNGLAFTVPADLAPGTYDLVMQTSYGKLTQINAVVVKTKPKLSSFTLKGTGSEIGSDLASEIKAIGSMHSADYSKIHCVVNTTDEAAAAIATQACSLLKTGSLSAATTLTTLKSTFKGSGFWLKVYLAG